MSYQKQYIFLVFLLFVMTNAYPYSCLYQEYLIQQECPCMRFQLHRGDPPVVKDVPCHAPASHAGEVVTDPFVLPKFIWPQKNLVLFQISTQDHHHDFLKNPPPAPPPQV